MDTATGRTAEGEGGEGERKVEREKERRGGGGEGGKEENQVNRIQDSKREQRARIKIQKGDSEKRSGGRWDFNQASGNHVQLLILQ
ncbi:hypothetical protein PDE_09003 [Penicillium oxalicum 114-2]|uniref:Uncharacterized protein n=1 Tax=Penicillium oxalicum (strain 114-2 / CGMCC 5302) TaxID=933388 RepID=S7ZYZ8_PENO1|nr:hypothetical protein PDE_09003 [Penicillium oxalicum 114-2]